MCRASQRMSQLLVGQLLEQEQRPEFVADAFLIVASPICSPIAAVLSDPADQASARYLCTNITAIEPFADGGGDPFGGLRAHVTCNEHTRHACFQMMRRTVEHPAAHLRHDRVPTG